MKAITVWFPDTANISVLPKDTPNITVSDGTTSIAGGTILALSDISDRVGTHKHPVVGEAGPPA